MPGPQESRMRNWAAWVVLLAACAVAAPRFWVGGAAGDETNWDNADNWAATSGGAGGAGVPGATDSVVVDGTDTTCILAADVSVSSIHVDSGAILDFAGNDVVTSGEQYYDGDLYNTGDGNGVLKITGDADMHFGVNCGTGVSADAETNESGTNSRIFAMDIDLRGTGELHNVSGGNHIFVRNLTCAYAGKTTTVQGDPNHPGPWILLHDGILTCASGGTLTIVARIFTRGLTVTNPVQLNGADLSASTGYLYMQTWAAIDVTVPALNLGSGNLQMTGWGALGQTFQVDGNITCGLLGIRADDYDNTAGDLRVDFNDVSVAWSGTHHYAYSNDSDVRCYVYYHGSTLTGTKYYQVGASDYGTYLDFGSSTWTISGDWIYSAKAKAWNTGTATVTFSGGNTITTSGQHLPQSTFLGSATFNRPTFAPGRTHTFAAESTYTIATFTNGDLDGASASLVAMVSSVPGTAYKMTFPSTDTVAFCDITDCDASGGGAVTANASTDGGGNSGISFGAAATYTTIGGDLSAHYVATAGTYHLTDTIDCGDFEWRADCVDGDVVVKVAGGSALDAFIITGTGGLASANGSGARRFVLTSSDDNAQGASIAGSDGTPASGDWGNVCNLTGGGGYYRLSNMEIWYQSSALGGIVWTATNTASNGTFEHIRFKYCTIPDVEAAATFLGSPGQHRMGTLSVTDLSIDTTNTCEDASLAYPMAITPTAVRNLRDIYIAPKGTAGCPIGLYIYLTTTQNISAYNIVVDTKAGISALRVRNNGAGTDSVWLYNCLATNSSTSDHAFESMRSNGVLYTKATNCVAINTTGSSFDKTGTTTHTALTQNCIDYNCNGASEWTNTALDTTNNPVLGAVSRGTIDTANFGIPNTYATTAAAFWKHGFSTFNTLGVDEALYSPTGVRYAGTDTLTAGVNYRFTLVLDSIIPTSGTSSGGDTVYWYGTWFGPDTGSATLGDSLVTVFSWTDTLVGTITGAGTAGTGDAVLTDAGSNAATLASGWEYTTAASGARPRKWQAYKAFQYGREVGVYSQQEYSDN